MDANLVSCDYDAILAAKKMEKYIAAFLKQLFCQESSQNLIGKQIT